MGSGRGLSVVVVAVAGLALFACRQSPQATVPEPVPDAVVTARVTTIDEARALRHSASRAEYLDALRSLASSHEPDVRRTARTLLGLELLADQQWPEAAATLREAAAEYPEIAPFLQLRIATAEEAQQHLAAAATALREAAAGSTSAASVAQLRLPAIHAALGDAASTDAAFDAAWAVKIDELTEADFVALADDLAKRGRTDLATRLRMRLLTNYTSGRSTEQTYQQLASELDAMPRADAVALAGKLGRANRYDQALDLMERLSKRFPEVVSDPAYRAIRIRALFSSRGYSTLLDEYPAASVTDPDLMLVRARAAWRANRPAEFLAGLESIEKSAPQSRAAAEAKILRAKYYTTDEANFAKSVENLQAGIDAGAAGNDGENLWTLGWTWTLAKDDARALATFDRYVHTYPDGDYKTNSLFWSAKILDAQGRTAERDQRARQLIAQFPFSYYAYRLKELWPVLADAKTDPTLVKPFPDVEGEVARLGEPRVATVHELTKVELHRDAAREAKALESAYPDNVGIAFLLADTYARGGEPFRANGVLQRRFRNFVRHGGENVPTRFWEILFPFQYAKSIEREAARRGIEPFLVASIIRQESGFEPTTVSNAGAVGLMQIMPAEAERIGNEAGIPNVTRESLFDPETNIAVGAAEFQQKLTRMNGNTILAIAAYNAGERAVGTWLEKTPIDDIDLFVESIPFAETRLYVKTVTRNRFEYRRIYEQTPAPSKQQQAAP